MNGWINLYKPSGYSSTFCLNLIKKKFKLEKIGHLGTLDPMAEGVLPIAINEATKTINYINHSRKKYLFEVQWGIETDTLDSEGKVIKTTSNVPEKKEVINIIHLFKGAIEQEPPKYSAKKINGRRAYDLARKGEAFSLKKVKKNIFNIRLINHDQTNKKSSFVVICEAGTYVRSLARDIAKELNSICYCTKILRLSDGFFKKRASFSFEKLINLKQLSDLDKYILDIQSVLYHIPTIKINDKKLKLIKNGMKVSMLDEVGTKEYQEILAEYNHTIAALGTMREGIFYPKKVLNIL